MAKLDLENFCEPRYSDSKYILTSPRSLQSCSNLGIKPVELLPKNFSNFRNDLQYQDINLRTVTEMFNECEKERVNKLELCREEWRRLKQSDSNVASISISHTVANAAFSCAGNGTETTRESNLVSKSVAVTSKQPASTQRLMYKHRKKHSRAESFVKVPMADGNSLSDMSSICSLPTSSSKQRQWNKSPAPNAKPVTDPLVRRNLDSAHKSSAKIKPKDEKLLHQMVVRRLEECEQRDKQLAMHRLWQMDGEKAAADKAAALDMRRKSLQEQQRLLGLQWARHKEVSSQVESDRVKQQEQHESETERLWAQAALLQKERQEKRIREKKMKDLERRKSVETRLYQQQTADEELVAATDEKLQRSLRRAQSVKTTFEQEQAMKVKLQNQSAERLHKERFERLQCVDSNHRSSLRASQDLKLTLALQKADMLHQQKLAQLRHAQQEKERRQEEARRRQRERGEELDKWHQDLAVYSEIQEKLANDRARKSVELKKIKTHADREKKEHMQKANFRRVSLQDQEYRTALEAELIMKDAKMEMLRREKEEYVEESRKLALTSQNMREELRRRFSTNDIEQLNKQAALEVRLANRVPSIVSASQVLIG